MEMEVQFPNSDSGGSSSSSDDNLGESFTDVSFTECLNAHLHLYIRSFKSVVEHHYLFFFVFNVVSYAPFYVFPLNCYSRYARNFCARTPTNA